VSQRDFRKRALVDQLMEQTARLQRLHEHVGSTRDYIEMLIEQNRRLTLQAFRVEAEMRKRGGTAFVERSFTSAAATADVMD
jgi:regulator of replication initiation timing